VSEPELVIFTGIPASGKTTYYLERLANTHVLISKDTWPNAKDKEQRQRALIDEHLRAGRSVVADNTSPSNLERGPLILIARALGAKVTSCFFVTTTQASLLRNAKREGKGRVPDVAIFTIAKRLVKPAASEGFDQRFEVRIEETGFVVKQLVAGVDD
jgi:predicted kinase